MKRILLIKLTSLGDLIHALPALSDAYRAYPDIAFDWAVDENFQEIATWHPAVKRIFTTNHRKWRDNLAHPKTFQSILSLTKDLRKTNYDLVIDGQGNFKTALLCSTTKGIKAGFDKNSVRERIAHFAYQKTYAVSKKAHAIERLRYLFAYALDYPVPTGTPEFMIDQSRFIKPKVDLSSNYLLFIHNASWKTKLWPEEHWQDLIKRTLDLGFEILLPWGNAEEEARAKRLCISSQMKVLPRLSLSEMGYVIANAIACVCMDTGLSHLTAALNIPAITLYGSTDSGLIGASGASQIHIQSNLHCAPCQKKTCRYPAFSLNPPCLAQITPDRVFEELKKLLGMQNKLHVLTSTLA